MTKAFLLTALITLFSVPAHTLNRLTEFKRQGQNIQPTVNSQEPPIKVAIATVGSSFAQPSDTFKVGDQILVTITMTNLSPTPLDACMSASLYQNIPSLRRDGAVVPYLKWQSYERSIAEHNHTCENENLPETVRLVPDVARLVDWFVLVDSRTRTGAEAWYDSLVPGKYELTIQRRLACCNGPMAQSNKISFVVEQ